MKSLAVKYRPKTFDDVVEQDVIKTILTQQLNTNTHQNCYLFVGGAGTGKTTCARIYANMLNEFKGTPVEIDAASNNGVDNVRDIIEQSRMAPINANYRIYIIDEVHMLTNQAWNAMLKLLEEPPAKAIFIMCTTDPQKIPNTILSRVQRFDFKRISHEAIVDQLKKIISAECMMLGEVLDISDEALDFIAKVADGGMRDAITLLDKCLSYTSNLELDKVVQVLGMTNYTVMVELLMDIINGQPEFVLETIEKVHMDGQDLKQFVKQFTNFLLEVCKCNYLSTDQYIQLPYHVYDRIVETFDTPQYTITYQLLDKFLDLNSKIKWETVPKPLIQATLLLFCLEVCNNDRAN